jgi:hypothetical protein
LARFVIDAPLAAARTFFQLNRACWKMVGRIYGAKRAA